MPLKPSVTDPNRRAQMRRFKEWENDPADERFGWRGQDKQPPKDWKEKPGGLKVIPLTEEQRIYRRAKELVGTHMGWDRALIEASKQIRG